MYTTGSQLSYSHDKGSSQNSIFKASKEQQINQRIMKVIENESKH